LFHQTLEVLGVSHQAGRRHTANARFDGTRLTSALFEASNPGGANAVLSGDLIVAVARITVDQNAFSQIQRISSHNRSSLTGT
jgi:hypothetical protein